MTALRNLPAEPIEEPDEWIDAAASGVSVWNDVPVVSNTPDSAPVPQQPLGEQIVESIQKPLYENPVSRAVIGGVGDAINGLIDTADEIGQTITGESYIPFNLPTVPEGDAVAEGLARDITQFMTGFASAGGMALKGLTKLTAAGAAGDVTFDPTEGNFSTFLRELDIDNSVTQFLDSQVGEDASAEERLRGRLANVAEGGLMGASIDLVVESLRWAKNNPEVTREALRKVLDKTTEFGTGGVIKEMPLERSIVEGTPVPKNMVITHNLSVDALVNADKIGGLPMPSLAVTKNTNPLDGFGDITLVAKPETFDPKNAKNRFFNADIYSPRYPKGDLKYSFDKAGIEQANDELSENTMKIHNTRPYGGLPDMPFFPGDVETHGMDLPIFNGMALQYEYLHRKGMAPELKDAKESWMPKRFQKYIPELTSKNQYDGGWDFIDKLMRNSPKEYTKFIRDVRAAKKAEYLKVIKNLEGRDGKGYNSHQ